ncbi:MAG: transcription termination factor NusA [Candidatus Omnitrophica bacterium]|nr:transcription termination factor NusA [Candidatus Omnitrophota bacterium]
MNGEILAVLEHIEREKGINKEILIAAVEAALVSAARKAIGITVSPEEEIKVKLDPKSGKITVFAGKEKIDSDKFGRIAAQTAKQVIIQKIREAEKDVVFEEFHSKVGTILSGTVYRFDKGNIIVDLLGKAEGLLPKIEQSPKEEFRQGERICAYLLDVRRESKGPQIVLSRSHPNLVRKLFALEVPEIYEGIVEIKAISRQAGERTKISVWSKDERVDSVGACVGMRGNRVKNIVTELHGEKIDIVRWSPDAESYISAALSPAQISQLKLDKENKRVSVIVEEDQLSLAIGKHGQNVRLASRLTGWNIDIRSKQMLEAAEKPKEEEKPKPAAKKKVAGDIISLKGVGEKLASSLVDAGFETLEEIAKASIKKLSEIKGLGKKKAEGLIKEAKELTKKNTKT